jgi:hypothetical protein
MSGYASARRHRGMQYRLPEPEYWELTVATTGASQDYSIDINSGSSVDITVDWGDGNAPVNYNSTGVKTCTYASADTYSIKITGSIVGGNIRLNVAGVSQRLKSTGIIGGITGLSKFDSTFQDCTALTSLPEDLFRYYPGVADYGFSGTFYGCTGLTSIPADLFRYNVAVGDHGFYRTFRGCTALTSIPADLFRYNIAVADYGFYGTFYGCTGLTSLPEDLFRYNVAVGDYGFYLTFYGCTALTSIPANLFRYNVAVADYAFNYTFYDCTGLTSIPADLFRYNIAVADYGFYGTFRGCTALTSIPANLFRYNVAVADYGFYRTFYGCNKLQLNPWIFYASGEEATRFASPVPTQDFTGCFMLTGAFTGTKGTAPALWDCRFNGTPTSTDCFEAHSTDSVDNYASIAAWK